MTVSRMTPYLPPLHACQRPILHHPDEKDQLNTFDLPEKVSFTLKTMPAMVVPVFTGVGKVTPDLLSSSFLCDT